jgi:hypothetical protein
LVSGFFGFWFVVCGLWFFLGLVGLVFGWFGWFGVVGVVWCGWFGFEVIYFLAIPL